MSKQPEPEPLMVTVFERGPYIQAALFCERVLQEKDGVSSLIRVIDRLTHTVGGPRETVPEKLEPFSYQMTLVVMLKSGRARGSYQVRIDIEPPSGEVRPGPSFPIHLEGDDRGVNLILNMNVQFTEPGLYWFNVYFIDKEDKLLTRIPFHLIYARQTTPGPPRAT